MSEVQIELFPARGGDCILITFEAIDYRILIDGGFKGTFVHSLASRLQSLDAAGKGIDLLAVTHVDNDHIMGIIALFEALKLQKIKIEIREIWYNGYRHLFTGQKQAVSFAQEKRLADETRKIDVSKTETCKHKEIGYSQGETLAKLLADTWGKVWNRQFNGKAVCCQNKGLSVGLYEKKLFVTLLNPGPLELKALEQQWNAFRRKKCLPLINGDSALYEDCFERFLSNTDASVTNQSSIAFLLTYAGSRKKTYQLLFLGDASAERCLERLEDWKSIPFDCFKLPHHGSKNNITQETLRQMHTEYLLFSTDGRKYGHPDWEVAEAAIQAETCEKLVFNYESCHAVSRIKLEYPKAIVKTGQGGYYKIELGGSSCAVLQ